MHRSSIDFPAPLGPIRATVCPASICRLIPSRTVRSRNRFVTLEIATCMAPIIHSPSGVRGSATIGPAEPTCTDREQLQRIDVIGPRQAESCLPVRRGLHAVHGEI